MRLFFFFLFFPLWGQTSPLTPYLSLGKDSSYSLGGQIQTDSGTRVFLGLQRDLGMLRGSMIGTLEKKIPPAREDSPYTTYPLLERGVYLGIRAGFVGLYSRVDGGRHTNWILHLEIHPNKTVYFFSHPEGETGRKGIGFLSGNNLRLGLELGKREGSVYDGTLSLSYQFTYATLGFQTTGEVPNSSHSSTALGIHSPPKKRESLWKEESPYEEEVPEREPKRFLQSKAFPIDHPFHKEKPQLPLSLDELLRKKIPLSESLLIQTASRKKESLESLEKKLPSTTVQKIHQLQREKWGGFLP